MPPTKSPIIVKPGLNRKTETLVPYYLYAAKFFKRRLGITPSRTTLHNYLNHGFPVTRGTRGSLRVQVPSFRLFRAMTSVEAMARFWKVVKKNQ